MNGKFHPVVLNGDGSVTVSGPFDPEQSNAKEATVFFVVVQGDGEPETVAVEGRGKWKRGQADWTAKVSRTGKRADGGDGDLDPAKDKGRVRGIAVAVASRPPEFSLIDPARYDPPTIEALTWCTQTTIVSATTGATQATAGATADAAAYAD